MLNVEDVSCKLFIEIDHVRMSRTSSKVRTETHITRTHLYLSINISESADYVYFVLID